MPRLEPEDGHNLHYERRPASLGLCIVDEFHDADHLLLGTGAPRLLQPQMRDCVVRW